MYAGSFSEPDAVLTSTMSPRSTPSLAAVSGCISTHELQTTFVTGSGSSCNHGLLAPRPSPSVGDGYVMRKNDSPERCVAFAATRPAVDIGPLLGRACAVPAIMPVWSA